MGYTKDDFILSFRFDIYVIDADPSENGKLKVNPFVYLLQND